MQRTRLVAVTVYTAAIIAGVTASYLWNGIVSATIAALGGAVAGALIAPTLQLPTLTDEQEAELEDAYFASQRRAVRDWRGRKKGDEEKQRGPLGELPATLMFAFRGLWRTSPKVTITALAVLAVVVTLSLSGVALGALLAANIGVATAAFAVVVLLDVIFRGNQGPTADR